MHIYIGTYLPMTASNPMEFQFLVAKVKEKSAGKYKIVSLQ